MEETDGGSPLFSIIITTYNSEATVRECLDSVLAQSEKSYEIIIIDDASADSTPEIIKEYEREHPEIKAIFHDVNRKKPRGLNEGIREARGAYISVLDSDDTVSPDCYLKRRRGLEAAGYPDVLISGYTLVENGKETVFGTPFPTGRKMTLDEALGSVGDLHTGNHLCFSVRMLFRRGMITENRITVNEKIMIGEDTDFNIRAMASARSIAACDENGYRYDISNPGSLTRSKYREGIEESIDLQYLTRVSVGMDIGSYKKDLAKYYVQTLTFIVINNQINSPEGLTPAALRRILDRRCFRETWKMAGLNLYHEGTKDLILRLLIKFRLTKLYCRIVNKNRK